NDLSESSSPSLTLFETDNSLSTHSSALETCNALSTYYHQTYLFDQEKNRYKQLIQSAIKKTSAYMKNTQKKLDALESKRPYDEIANIIMANLHAIPDKAESITLTDFYTNSHIKIKLKVNTSPQKLAEQYYRKSKNQSKERENLQQNLKSKEGELDSLKSLSTTLTEISDRRQLRQFVNLNLADQVSKQEEKRLPYYQQEIDGFEVRIGKSAKDNDLMIRQYAHKDDIWLHARDVPGSHVLIRHQKNRKVNEEVIEKVAQLAAHYSKRKHDSLAPVIYTPRKFVRKSKNLAPGQVLVDKENVILVKPSKTPSL
ncbi:MAG: NFACT RNA binding domain-containing protein, partial [Bacteroidota bacterium]